MNYKSATWFPSQNDPARMVKWFFFLVSLAETFLRSCHKINNCACKHTTTVAIHLWKKIMWNILLFCLTLLFCLESNFKIIWGVYTFLISHNLSTYISLTFGWLCTSEWTQSTQTYWLGKSFRALNQLLTTFKEGEALFKCLWE